MFLTLSFTRGKKGPAVAEKAAATRVTAARGHQSATLKKRGKWQASRAPVRFNSQFVISSQQIGA